jgi:hypothetical protein
MIQYTQIEAQGQIYNVPSSVKCECGKQAQRQSDVEPDIHNEQKYIAYYQCDECHQNIRAFVNLREE